MHHHARGGRHVLRMSRRNQPNMRRVQFGAAYGRGKIIFQARGNIRLIFPHFEIIIIKIRAIALSFD